jgi:hypothetical protein
MVPIKGKIGVKKNRTDDAENPLDIYPVLYTFLKSCAIMITGWIINYINKSKRKKLK